MNSAFNLIFPCCYWSEKDKERFQCRCCLKITEDNFSLLLLSTNSGQVSPITIKLSTFKTMHAKQGICRFESDVQDFSLIFIDPSFTHQSRFLYSLVDSCSAIPVTPSKYAIMNKPLFIPNGQFPLSEKSITNNVHSIFRQRINQILSNKSEDVNDTFLNYSCAFISSMLKLASQRFAHQNPDLNKLLKDEQEAAKWLLSFTPQNSKEYQQAAKAFQSGITQQVQKDLNVIKEDSVRFRTSDKRWNASLQKACENVCLAMCASGHPYLQGEFDICAKCALTLFSTFPDKTQEETIFTAARAMFNLIPLENRIAQSSIRLISQKVLEIISAISPEISEIFQRKEWQIFLMFGNDISAIYSRSYHDIWKLWKWIFDSKDKIISLSIFCTSVLLFSLPTIAEHNSNKIDETLQYWDKEICKFNIDELLYLSNYLMDHCFNSEKHNK